MNFLQSLDLNAWITLGVIHLLLLMAVGAIAYRAYQSGTKRGYANARADEAMGSALNRPSRRMRDYTRYLDAQ